MCSVCFNFGLVNVTRIMVCFVIYGCITHFMATDNTKCIGTIALKLKFMFNIYHVKLFLFMYIINQKKKKKKKERKTNTTLVMCDT
jgi:hypothetical protein